MTSEVHTCVLLDGTVRKFPLAKVQVDTPYYVGEVECMCMEKPICDLIIGNFLGVQEATVGPQKDGQLPEDSKELPVGVAQAVVTRNHFKRAKESLRPLTVEPSHTIGVVDVQDLQRVQKDDQTLERLFGLAKEGKEFITKRYKNFWFEVQKEVLYRVCDEPKGDTSVQIKQVVVPGMYRSQVMSLAHESIVSGHMGSKETLERILTSFYGPGIGRDVIRFCRSCDICQKVVPKGRVTKVPLGRMPIMHVPFHRVAINLIGPLAASLDRGNGYILTVVDYAIRYPEAVALRKKSTLRRWQKHCWKCFAGLGFQPKS